MAAKNITARENVAEKVNKHIDELIENKTAQLKEVAGKMAAARKEQAEAEKALQKATESTDLDAYNAAKAEITRTSGAIEMYSARYTQLQNNEYVPDKESDAVIQSLIDYERQLDREYAAAIAPHLEELARITKEYQGGVGQVEDTMDRWTRDIHRNYRDIDGIRYDRPRTVRTVPYLGCKACIDLSGFLKKIGVITR